MKKTILLLFIGLATGLFAQDSKTKLYSSFSSEMIFSFAEIQNLEYDQGNVMRWAPALNMQTMVNLDFNDYFGLFSGAAVRNVGFIYDNPFDGKRYKYRTYNFGIPVGFKIGKLSSIFLFGGYEIEFPFVYKEKLFVDEVKEDKFVVWFSDRVEPFQQSLLAGIQFPYGPYIKFKYYLTNFHNRDFKVTEDNLTSYPYDFSSNIFYFSIGWNIFTNWKAYEPKNLKVVEIR